MLQTKKSSPNSKEHFACVSDLRATALLREFSRKFVMSGAPSTNAWSGHGSLFADSVLNGTDASSWSSSPRVSRGVRRFEKSSRHLLIKRS